MAPAKKTKTTRKKATKTETSETDDASLDAEWQKLMAQHASSPTRDYAMKSAYKLGEKIRHPKFGEGIVGKLIYPNKIEVIFQTDMKVLIHAGPKGLEMNF